MKLRNKKQICRQISKLFVPFFHDSFTLGVVLTLLGLAASDILLFHRGTQHLLAQSAPNTLTSLSAKTLAEPAHRSEQFLTSQPINRTQTEEDWAYFKPNWKHQPKLGEDAWEGSPDKGHSTAQFVNWVLSDPRHALTGEFVPSSRLRSRVALWVTVYGVAGSATRVIHDRRDPGLLYGFLDVSTVYQQLGNSVAADLKIHRIERNVIQKLRVEIAQAVRGTGKASGELRAFLSEHGAADLGQLPNLLDGVRSQTGQADIFALAIERARDLLPYIEAVFARAGLPKEGTRIPFVESSFHDRAASKVGAIGIWQFTRDAARMFIRKGGELEQQAYHDPLRQTEGAARMLQFFRSQLPDWGCAITAYNSGVGRLKGLVSHYHAHHLEEILEVDSHGLGFAGKNFFAEVLAANLVQAYQAEIFSHRLKGSTQAAQPFYLGPSSQKNPQLLATFP